MLSHCFRSVPFRFVFDLCFKNFTKCTTLSIEVDSTTKFHNVICLTDKLSFIMICLQLCSIFLFFYFFKDFLLFWAVVFLCFSLLYYSVRKKISIEQEILNQIYQFNKNFIRQIGHGSYSPKDNLPNSW